MSTFRLGVNGSGSRMFLGNADRIKFRIYNTILTLHDKRTCNGTKITVPHCYCPEHSSFIAQRVCTHWDHKKGTKIQNKHTYRNKSIITYK